MPGRLVRYVSVKHHWEIAEHNPEGKHLPTSPDFFSRSAEKIFKQYLINILIGTTVQCSRPIIIGGLFLLVQADQR